MCNALTTETVHCFKVFLVTFLTAKIIYASSFSRGISSPFVKDLGYGYAKDSWTVYFAGRKVDDASAINFKVLTDGYAKDPWAAYYMGKKLNGASAISFQSLGNGVAKDAFSYYLYGRRTNGLVPPMYMFH